MSTEAAIVLSTFVVAAGLLMADVLRIDIVAILCLLVLAWTGILEPLEALSGFASNAVIAMIAVMIMGKGLARTGLMDSFSRLVPRVAGRHPSRIAGVVSGVAGLAGGFVHNVGTAVLFLPAVLNIARRESIPVSRLVMPIGFAVILSGTITMVGSSPLILVNDFLAGSSLDPYGLFAVTPAGLALLVSGIAFFFVLGSVVLPRRGPAEEGGSIQQRLIHDWQLSSSIWHYRVPEGSPIVGQTLEATGIWDRYGLNILAMARRETLEYAPWRETLFEPGQAMALMGREGDVRRFAAEYGLEQQEKPGRLEALGDPTNAGFAEVIVPPRSAIAGQSIRKFGLRRRYGVEPVLLYHRGERVQGDFSDQAIASGDVLIVHGLWERIVEIRKGNDFLLVTPVEADRKDRSRVWIALVCFAVAIGLSIAGFPISIAFLSGAMAMVLTRVVGIDEAYHAIDWKVVFFLAGFISLGAAMQKTGAAALLAEKVMLLVEGSHPALLLLAISGMTAVLSLFVSNVGAMVIMAPMAISMAGISGLDPRPMVLLVAVSTANSFVLPTHQVNALLKTPGGYVNSDYLKAGAGISAVFLLVVVAVFYFFYL